MERLNLLDRTKTSTLTLLDGLNWITDLAPRQVEELSLFFQPYSAEAGTIVLMEGERAHFFCLICEGSVDVVKENSSGKLKKLKTFGSGKILGEMAFFDGGPSSATIIVKEDVMLLVMDDHAFENLCAQSPLIALKVLIHLIRALSHRLRETSGKLIDYL